MEGILPIVSSTILKKKKNYLKNILLAHISQEGDKTPGVWIHLLIYPIDKHTKYCTKH